MCGDNSCNSRYDISSLGIRVPRELIAQYPSPERGKDRLLVVDRKSGEIIDDTFERFDNYITEMDCLVYNDAKVIHARLYGKKYPTGAKIELLLTKRISDTDWRCLLRPAKRLKEGSEIIIDDELVFRVLEKLEDGLAVVRSNIPVTYELLEKKGQIPLPLYIKRKPLKELDEERYQTIYSSTYGAVASPTAGLHFTKDIIEKIRGRGIPFVPVTLYVDWGTFKPVKEKDYRKHKIHEEDYFIREESARMINECISQGRRIVCIGTTTVRVLETVADETGIISHGSGRTSLYIYPGYRFKITGALLTNFHMPDSTLILLVAAFMGEELLKKAYNHAVEHQYRFFSYGDAMFIV